MVKEKAAALLNEEEFATFRLHSSSSSSSSSSSKSPPSSLPSEAAASVLDFYQKWEWKNEEISDFSDFTNLDFWSLPFKEIELFLHLAQ